MDLNRATLIGNLTRDPEVRTTPGGQTVASFGVATNLVWTDQSGQRQQKVEYHNIVAWRRLAEICSQYLHKGNKIFIEGRIQNREWEGQDGVKRYRTEIVAENLIMLERPPVSGSSAPAEEYPRPEFPTAQPQRVNSIEPQQTAAPEEELRVDNIPF